jgi:hypothetical protein
MPKFLVKHPGSDPLEVEVADDQDAMYQALSTGVGGWLQHVTMVADGVRFDVWMNEEGKLLGLPINLRVPGDVFVGNLVMTGSDDSTGKTLGLSGVQLEAATKWAQGKASKVEWMG